MKLVVEDKFLSKKSPLDYMNHLIVCRFIHKFHVYTKNIAANAWI